MYKELEQVMSDSMALYELAKTCVGEPDYDIVQRATDLYSKICSARKGLEGCSEDIINLYEQELLECKKDMHLIDGGKNGFSNRFLKYLEQFF